MHAEANRLLEVKNLKVYFEGSNGKQLRAVDDLSFGVQRGEMLGIVGESGSGKSVSCKAIPAAGAPRRRGSMQAARFCLTGT